MATALQIVRKFYPEVESVRDSNKNIKIEVTKRDTQSSAVKNHKECALAQACKRSLAVDGAIIAVKFAYLIKDKQAVRYSVPESVSREITAFDRNAEFEIGMYHLSKVSEANKIGNLKNRPGKHTKQGRKVYENIHKTQNIRHIGEK